MAPSWTSISLGVVPQGVVYKAPDAANAPAQCSPDGRTHRPAEGAYHQCCQMAKFDPFLSLDCARVEGMGRNPRKGGDQILQRSVAEI